MKEIGDILTLKVPKENRDWGYNPAPDGTKCTITGWGDITYGRTNNCGIEAGIYENRCWIDVKFIINGKEEHKNIGSFCFEERDINGKWDGHKKLADLPETNFWEWDIVRLANGKPIISEWGLDLKVTAIEWHWERDKRGYCYQVESVSLPNTGCTYLHDSELELVQRGKVWDYYHKNPLHFENLREEAQFYSAIGRTDEVRNPINQLYKWNLNEALSAIISGLGDAIHVGTSFLSLSPRITVDKYRDADIGQRVAKETLAGFRSYLDGEPMNGEVFKLVNFPKL